MLKNYKFCPENFSLGISIGTLIINFRELITSVFTTPLGCATVISLTAMMFYTLRNKAS